MAVPEEDELARGVEGGGSQTVDADSQQASAIAQVPDPEGFIIGSGNVSDGSGTAFENGAGQSQRQRQTTEQVEDLAEGSLICLMKSFGETIRNLRSAQALGLRETASKVGISPAYLRALQTPVGEDEVDKRAPASPAVRN